MASNKHAQIRYKVLDDCLSNFGRKFYFQDLLDECNEKLAEYYGENHEVKTRTLRSDISYLRDRASECDVEILAEDDGNGFFYRYSKPNFSIFHQGLGENDLAQLKETVLMLQRFKGMPNFDWMSEILVKIEDKLNLKGKNTRVIDFQENKDYSGLDWIEEIFDAISNRQVIEITYRTFNDTTYTWTIHPYYLKQYNNRWFLFGLNDFNNKITNIPLDRIDDIDQIHKEFKPSTIDFEHFFDDVIGVTVLDDEKEDIRLKFSKQRFPYVMTKSLHNSQKIVDFDEGIIEISVIPNNELDALILSFGKDVEVLLPKTYRAKIKELTKTMAARY